MSNDISGILRKGIVIVNSSDNREGTVIDWGIPVSMKSGLAGEEKEILLPHMQQADAIRVQTSDGTIEIWQKKEIDFPGY